MGCAFDIVLKGFVETACLGLLGELYMPLTSIFLITLNINTTPKSPWLHSGLLLGDAFGQTREWL